MATPFLGQILLVPYNFAPRGFALCNGQIMAISQNTALFSLLGTTYGGDGVSNFALPDLRGRVPISSGQGPGTNYSLGAEGGEEQVVLSTSQLPAHTHDLPASRAPSLTEVPNSSVVPAAGGAYGEPADATLKPTSVTGQGQPVNTMPPYLVMNYVIALQGIFPSRS